jgi:hypothetical protein
VLTVSFFEFEWAQLCTKSEKFPKGQLRDPQVSPTNRRLIADPFEKTARAGASPSNVFVPSVGTDFAKDVREQWVVTLFLLPLLTNISPAQASTVAITVVGGFSKESKSFLIIVGTSVPAKPS